MVKGDGESTILQGFFMLNIHISGRKLWLLQCIIRAEHSLSKYHANIANYTSGF